MTERQTFVFIRNLSDLRAVIDRHVATTACRVSRRPAGTESAGETCHDSIPRMSSACSRISTLRTFPVTVIGNSSTTWTYRGIL